MKNKVGPIEGYCFASDMVAKDKLKVMFMYREYPDSPQDSGWRFFSGFESDEYASNPENLNVYDVKTITDIDSSIVEFLNSPPGTAFERLEESDAFTKIEDFELEFDDDIMEDDLFN